MAINVGNSLTALAAIMGAERMFLNQLKGVDADQLHRLMASNRPLVLPEQVAMLVPFYRNNPGAFESHYTVDYILKKVRMVRPDLWTLITSSRGGVQWVSGCRAEVLSQIKMGQF